VRDGFGGHGQTVRQEIFKPKTLGARGLIRVN